MLLLVATEHHFVKTPDGVMHSATGGRDYDFWCRYLEVFSEVIVVSRVRQSTFIPQNLSIGSGPGVRFLGLPDYVGSRQYLWRLKELKNKVRLAVTSDAAVILRVPGAIGELVWHEIRKSGQPYGVEVVGDPYDVFAPGSVKHPLRPFFRWWFSRQLRRQCAGACAAAYVTEQYLQQRYPADPDAFVTHYSSVELPDAAFVPAPRRIRENTRQRFTLVFVGTLAQLYKAPDVLIDAVGICVQDGLDLRLVFVGDGKHRSELEAKTVALDLGERINFLGQLSAGEAIRAQLDQADIFILPSRQEGLPRAMIEAMARGLPCIGSTVGGIPELLPRDDLVPPGDTAALARKIREVVTDPARMACMSARNLERAKAYRNEVLHDRRVEFFQYVRETTETWLKRRKY